jgi:methylamine dehydrogenase heavy chain
VDGDDIDISDAWSMISEEDAEEKWRPGGSQLKSVHEGTGLMYVLMHQGGEYTHQNPGTEVWVYNLAAQRRIARLELADETSNIMVTQESEPKLIVADKESGLHIYDALKLKLDRTIEDSGPAADLIQDF